MLPPGTMIGTRYRVVRLLGQGGMSNLYVCQDTHLADKTFAVKEMTARYSNPEEQAAAVNQFQREAHLLARLHHPNLPTVTDYYQFQGRYYLVMEYVEGEDLGRMLARVAGPLPERQVAEWGAEIATVLYYLHCQKPDPIIFRDVKPSNIMVNGPKVKLIDFGIARLFNPSKKGDTMRIGSPGYAPPEQYSGQTDPRSDIYALGVTLHQALTGRDPTQTQTPFHLPPVRSLNPHVSEEMARIIQRATQMLPENRYQDMLAMKRDLKSLVSAQRGGTAVVHGPGPQAPEAAASQALPPSPPLPVASPAPPAPRAKPRKGLPWSRVAAVLLVLLGLGFGVVALGQPGTLSRLRAWLPAWPSAPEPVAEAGRRLYLEGAPLEVVLPDLARERDRAPASGAAWIFWNNALAGLESSRPLTLGAVIPEGPGGDQALRGLALAQRALNGLGGIRQAPVVLVLERPKPEEIPEAMTRLAEGRAGRQVQGPDGPQGQAVSALLVFAEAGLLAGAPPLKVPTLVVGSSAAPAAQGSLQVLKDPTWAGAARALAALAGSRPLVVFSPDLPEALKAQGKAATRAAAERLDQAPALVRENPGALFALSSEGLAPSRLAALLAAGGEVVLVAAGDQDLPAVPEALRPRLRAVVAVSCFHPWRDGAAAARLYPALFGPKPPALDLPTARAYDALRWAAGSVLGEAGEYRGATLAAGQDGQALEAPWQLFETGPQGWYNRSLEATER